MVRCNLVICGDFSGTDVSSGIGLASCRECVGFKYLYGACSGWLDGVCLKCSNTAWM